VFTLTAGKTYLLQADLCISNFSANTAYAWWSWVDSTTNAQLDTSNGSAVATGSSGVAIPATWVGTNDQYAGTARLIYTPVTSQTVKVRMTDGSGTCTILAIASKATITQINPSFALQGNVSITGNIVGTSPNVQLVAGSYTYTFDNTGNVTLPTGGDLIFSANTTMTSVSNGNITIDPNGTGQLIVTSTTPAQFGNIISATGNISTSGRFVGNGSALTSVATQSSGSWTLATGTNTVSFTVTAGRTYSMWVNGNIPNGILVWNATATVTNTNVPVIGQQFGWYYSAGNALVLTSIPSQIIGTAGSISNASPAVSNTNVFNFTIVNNSGSSQTVYYGWTQIS
jgi:hypothetical protein